MYSAENVGGSMKTYTVDKNDPEQGGQKRLAAKEGLTFEPRCAAWGDAPWLQG